MFACKDCGGNVKFDIQSGQLSCEYCHSMFDPYTYEDKTSDAQEVKDFDATIFTCPQCGGEILSTDDTAAGFCSFCGASTVLYSRIEKQNMPSYIIPFAKTKEDCRTSFSSLMSKAIFAPKDYKTASADSFRGIYMPYWAYHISQKGMFSIPAEKSHRRGDYIITDHYNLIGDVDAYYKGLSYDASSSFEDDISTKLAPYDTKGMKRFTPAFLSGFYADTADVASSVYLPEVENTAYENTSKKIMSTPQFRGYSVKGSLLNNTSAKATLEAADYAMFPVWFMSYKNGDRVSYATVNGQTGKIVADIPIDIKKFIIGSLIAAIPIFILLCLVTTLTPGVLLTIVGVLSALCGFLYSRELSDIIAREENSFDKGKLSKTNPDAVSQFDANNRGKSQRKANKKVKSFGSFSWIFAIVMTVYVLIFMFGFFHMSFITSLASSGSNTDGSTIAWFIAILICAFFDFKSFSKTKKLSDNQGFLHICLKIAAVLVATVVIFLQPVYDIFYYGAAFLVLAALLVNFISILNAYNMLASRKLPQFDTHKGGDDRA